MSHTHVICEEGYTIRRCRCPGGITAVKPCYEGHTHGPHRWEPKVGDAILIEETVTPTISVDIVDDALSAIYGAGPMVTALATHIVAKWDEWDADERRDLPTLLHLCIWDWFPGGDTASLAADRIMVAVECGPMEDV